MRIFLIICFFLSTLASCEDAPLLLPKPRTYPRVIYPERQLQNYTSEECPFSFTYPDYMQVLQDPVLLKDEEQEHSCWFDLYAPSLSSRLHMSYVPIEGENTLKKLHDDAFKLAYQHNVKATSIEEQPFENTQNARGFIFSLKGPVASAYMFYLTEESKHFLRGSLYFDTKSRPDSLAPVLEFVKQDVNTILETFRWTDGKE